MDWVIRRVEASEAELILPLFRQVQALHAAARPEAFKAPSNSDELLGVLREMLGPAGLTGLVAAAPSGEALGYAIYGVEVIEPSAQRHGQRLGLLHHVCVDRDWHRRGIGSALVEATKAGLREQGIARVRATYWSFNEASAALMRRAGMEPSHIRAEGPV